MTGRREAGEGGSPNCPNCRSAFGLEVPMRGPTMSPVEDSTGRFFICDRCNHTLRDRRGRKPKPSSPTATP